MNLLQRHDEWLADRVGKITASRVKDISAKPRKGKALNSIMLNRLIPVLTGNRHYSYLLFVLPAVNPRAYGEQLISRVLMLLSLG